MKAWHGAMIEWGLTIAQAFIVYSLFRADESALVIGVNVGLMFIFAAVALMFTFDWIESRSRKSVRELEREAFMEDNND